MIVKIHKTENKQILVAVCDKELLGKKFEECNKQLDLSSDFYDGDERSDKETSDIMRNSYMLNLVGEKTIKLALEDGLILPENIKKIADIPYANIILQ